jgi:hypothetical protein
MIKVAIAIAFVALGSVVAHAQRYDSSYGYEMRGFVPPPPWPRAWRERDSVAEPTRRERDRPVPHAGEK